MSQPSAKILIVDDEPHMAYVLRYKLETAGHRVIITNNGADAYEIACTQRPDAVVSDFRMPGGSGFELATRLHANPETAHIPLIMLTARAHKLKPSEIVDTNIQHLMEKPFSPTELLEKLNELLLEMTTRDAGDRAA
ncbi:MAG: response regulator [Phycisphaerales bacterium]|nr:MAG: response regulator [Phycisphaerales bacterium]